MKNFTLLFIFLLIGVFGSLKAQSQDLTFDFETWVDSSGYQRPEPVNIFTDPNSFIRALGGGFLTNPNGDIVPQCEPTSDAKSGSQAAMLRSQFYNYFTAEVALRGWLYTGSIKYSGQTYITTSDLRIESTEKYQTFSGWYKYEKAAGSVDSCVFIAELYAADSTVIASAVFKSDAVSDYTHFEIPFIYTDESADVTHMGMYICASNGTAVSSPFRGIDGSVLKIDDLSLSTTKTGVRNLVGKSLAIAYPDSKHENLIVKDAENASMEIYSVSGSLLSKHSIKSIQDNISISNLNEGIFLYRIISKDGLLKTGRFVK